MKWWKEITEEDKELNKDHYMFQITSEMKRMWCPIIWSTDRRILSQYCHTFSNFQIGTFSNWSNTICTFNIVLINKINQCFSLLLSTFSNFQIIKFSNWYEGDEDFLWNRNFIALSVGQSSIEALRTYIKAQEVIHKKKTYRQEFTEIVEKYGFKR